MTLNIKLFANEKSRNSSSIEVSNDLTTGSKLIKIYLRHECCRPGKYLLFY